MEFFFNDLQNVPYFFQFYQGLIFDCSCIIFKVYDMMIKHGIFIVLKMFTKISFIDLLKLLKEIIFRKKSVMM